MNQTVKQKWVEALRSGKYKKGEAVLKKGDCFCVLGVLCDLYRKDKQVKGWGQDDYFFTPNGATYDILPAEVMRWADIEHPMGPVLTVNGEEDFITSYNDGNEEDPALSFQELAKLIDTQC